MSLNEKKESKQSKIIVYCAICENEIDIQNSSSYEQVTCEFGDYHDLCIDCFEKRENG